MKYHLRPVGNAGQYSDAADYPTKPADRPGFEWVEGSPPVDAVPYVELSTVEQLKAVFVSLPVATQAALGPLAASVLMFLDQNNPEAAQLVIAGATIPQELESLREQMLELFTP